MIEIASLVDNTSECVKIELVLGLDNFNKPDEFQKLPAVAQKFITLLMTIPGTYPDHPNMGINIDQYMFDFLDDETCTKIQDHIKRQTDEYMPDSGINLIVVKPQTDPITNVTNILGIAVSLTDLSDVASEFFLYLKNEADKDMKVTVQY